MKLLCIPFFDALNLPTLSFMVVTNEIFKDASKFEVFRGFGYQKKNPTAPYYSHALNSLFL